MNTCQWCGDRHGADQLCQRAQRGMTRRSFCFLFGVGVAGAMLPNVAPRYEYSWVGGPETPKPFVVNDVYEAYYRNVLKPIIVDMELRIETQLGRR